MAKLPRNIFTDRYVKGYTPTVSDWNNHFDSYFNFESDKVEWNNLDPVVQEIIGNKADQATLDALAKEVANKVDWDEVDAPDGVCPLDENRKVPTDNLPDSMQGADRYMGNIDLDAGETLPANPEKGDYYVITGEGYAEGGSYRYNDRAKYNGNYWVRERGDDANAQWIGGISVSEDFYDVVSDKKLLTIKEDDGDFIVTLTDPQNVDIPVTTTIKYFDRTTTTILGTNYYNIKDTEPTLASAFTLSNNETVVGEENLIAAFSSGIQLTEQSYAVGVFNINVFASYIGSDDTYIKARLFKLNVFSGDLEELAHSEVVPITSSNTALYNIPISLFNSISLQTTEVFIIKLYCISYEDDGIIELQIDSITTPANASYKLLFEHDSLNRIKGQGTYHLTKDASIYSENIKDVVKNSNGDGYLKYNKDADSFEVQDIDLSEIEDDIKDLQDNVLRKDITTDQTMLGGLISPIFKSNLIPDVILDKEINDPSYLKEFENPLIKALQVSGNAYYGYRDFFFKNGVNGLQTSGSVVLERLQDVDNSYYIKLTGTSNPWGNAYLPTPSIENHIFLVAAKVIVDVGVRYTVKISDEIDVRCRYLQYDKDNSFTITEGNVLGFIGTGKLQTIVYEVIISNIVKTRSLQVVFWNNEQTEGKVIKLKYLSLIDLDTSIYETIADIADKSTLSLYGLATINGGDINFKNAVIGDNTGNGFVVYGNSGAGVTAIIEQNYTVPTASNKIFKVTTGLNSSWLLANIKGGIGRSCSTPGVRKLFFKVVARIPIGEGIRFGVGNSTGITIKYFLGKRYGTGDFEEYIGIIDIASNGNPQNVFVGIANNVDADGNDTGRIQFDVMQAEVYDATEGGYSPALMNETLLPLLNTIKNLEERIKTLEER